MKDTYVIRPLAESDIEQLIILIKLVQGVSFKKLYSQELIEVFSRKYTPEAFLRRMKYTQFLIAVKGKELVGVIGLKGIMVRSFYVHPDYQGKGLGSILYKKLEELARTQGLSELTLESSLLGLPIYIHYGFKKEREIEIESEGIKYKETFMRKILI